MKFLTANPIENCCLMLTDRQMYYVKHSGRTTSGRVIFGGFSYCTGSINPPPTPNPDFASKFEKSYITIY